MKLIIAVIHESDYHNVVSVLNFHGFRVTCIASTGGFLKLGNSTILIGTEDSKVEDAIFLIKENCVTPNPSVSNKATIFVLNVSEQIQL